jgi:hypothetical protein
MNTPQEFREAVDRLAREFGLSVTSGRRSPEHSVAVGGGGFDPHVWGAGADLIPLPASDILRDRLADRAKALGLKLIFESDHAHAQPFEWPAGPVTTAPDPSWGGMYT